MKDKFLCVMAQYDPKSERKFRKIQKQLQSEGFSGQQTQNLPNHITLGTFEPEKEDEMKLHMEETVKSIPAFPIAIGNIGLFNLNVLFLAPITNHELLYLHQSFMNDFKEDYGWVAHTTMLIDSPEIIQKAIPVVSEHFKSFNGKIESVSLYEFWPTRFIGEYRLQEPIYYEKLSMEEVKLSLFDGFKRHQEVKKCWRKEEGVWILKDIAFTEQWDEKDYTYLTECLLMNIKTGGSVIGVFREKRLTGFASVEKELFGMNKEYVELTSIHVSEDCRGHGYGKRLFELACREAVALGAKKLYISAHSSEESQAFYKKIGCIEAVEYNARCVEKEPCDCQMEYDLGQL